MNSLPEDRFFSEALELEDPVTLLFVALAAFIGRLAYLLLGIYKTRQSILGSDGIMKSDCSFSL